VCVCEAVSTPLKKRRLTADAMSSSFSSSLADDGSSVDKQTSWPSVDNQFESKRRMLASRNLFEVRFHMFNVVFVLKSVVVWLIGQLLVAVWSSLSAVCVCLCVWTISFKQNIFDLAIQYL